MIMIDDHDDGHNEDHDAGHHDADHDGGHDDGHDYGHDYGHEADNHDVEWNFVNVDVLRCWRDTGNHSMLMDPLIRGVAWPVIPVTMT